MSRIRFSRGHGWLALVILSALIWRLIFILIGSVAK